MLRWIKNSGKKQDTLQTSCSALLRSPWLFELKEREGICCGRQNINGLAASAILAAVPFSGMDQRNVFNLHSTLHRVRQYCTLHESSVFTGYGMDISVSSRIRLFNWSNYETPTNLPAIIISHL